MTTTSLRLQHLIASTGYVEDQEFAAWAAPHCVLLTGNLRKSGALYELVAPDVTGRIVGNHLA